ncbi:DegT/DnrJ/EryC1/StrS family aminotransferase [Halorubrum sp. SY-15]|uniref:DegT/DnrJ/EryC1/StrS family aminotransferase n=1 Tax=Halorubrum sp. SY-15 TaxID=3402277 RepID=UPI003EB737DB
MSEEIPLFEISWDEEDISNVVQSISRGSYWAKGPFVDQFETELESYFGANYAISVNSGTTALVTALKACGIGNGDEVIVPSFTFIATANAVKLVGAEPVFADIELDTFGLDPASVRSKITENTAAIIPVHLYGAPCQIHKLTEIAANHDLWVIEDAAEAFGATANGDLVGTIGDIAALSFCQNKILPTGEGGAIITDDATLAAAISQFSNHGRTEGEYFDSVESGEYVTVGSNYRMADMVAAVGCAQLSKVDDLIESRQNIAARYHDGLSAVNKINPHKPVEGHDHVYQLYTVLCEDKITRSHIINALTAANISCKIYWDTPVHRNGTFASEQHQSLPQTEDVSDRVVSLPMYPTLPLRDVERVVKTIRDACENI